MGRKIKTYQKWSISLKLAAMREVTKRSRLKYLFLCNRNTDLMTNTGSQALTFWYCSQ